MPFEWNIMESCNSTKTWWQGTNQYWTCSKRLPNHRQSRNQSSVFQLYSKNTASSGVWQVTWSQITQNNNAARIGYCSPTEISPWILRPKVPHLEVRVVSTCINLWNTYRKHGLPNEPSPWTSPASRRGASCCWVRIFVMLVNSWMLGGMGGHRITTHVQSFPVVKMCRIPCISNPRAPKNNRTKMVQDFGPDGCTPFHLGHWHPVRMPSPNVALRHPNAPP